VNHRIVGVGRDLCGSSSPTPLPKHGHCSLLYIPAKVSFQLVSMRSIEDNEVNSRQVILSYGNYLFKGNKSESFFMYIHRF